MSGHQTKLWVDKNQTMASLIREHIRSWCLNSIRNLIPEEKCLGIEATYVGDSGTSDRLIWPMEKEGNFSVKSGYRWIQNKKRSQNQWPSSSCMTDLLVWKGIWSPEASPKIRNFMWRIAKGVIATHANLFKKKCAPSPVCPICNEYEETVEHLLLMCPWVEPVWFRSPLGYKIDRCSVTNINAWLV
ncbi:hypothetical protein ACFXTH_002702 [Malus domestica]